MSSLRAVETALKAARKWAYEVKGVPTDAAEIIVCRGNFHGRTITAVGMSTDPLYRKNFGPFPPGFRAIDYGDAQALETAIDSNTAAFLVEPIQGEGGINVPPVGYLAACASICRANNVLLICDEIQTGLGRTGRFLASEYENVTPDGLVLGKALGGGLYPVSMFLAKREVLDLFKPGDHGSTFGGNPLGATVGLVALNVLIEEKLIENSEVMGEYFRAGLNGLNSPLIADIRGRGLLIGLEIDARRAGAKTVCCSQWCIAGSVYQAAGAVHACSSVADAVSSDTTPAAIRRNLASTSSSVIGFSACPRGKSIRSCTMVPSVQVMVMSLGIPWG